MKNILAVALIIMMSLAFTSCSPKKTEVQSSASSEIDSKETDLGFDDISGDSTTSGSSQSKAQNNSAIKGGWTGEQTKYTPEEMDKPYEIRKNIKGKVTAFHPFAQDSTTIKAVKMFKAAYPQAQLEVINVLYASMDEKLMALTASGSSPDFVFDGYVNYPFRAVRKLTMPIDQYIKPHPALNDFLMNNYASYKGKKYSVIWYEPPYVLWYNKTLFNKKGEKTPGQYFEENNWTWDTLKQVAKRMTDTQNGIWGFGTDIDWFFPASVGEDIVRFDKGKATLNIVGNTKFSQAYQFFLDMILIDKSAKQEHWNSYNVFGDGQMAMYYGTSAHSREFDKRKPAVDYDFTLFPKHDKNSPYVGASAALMGGFGIGVGSKNIEGGMAFGEMCFNAEMAIRGNLTQPLYRKIFETAQKAKMQYVTTWSYGYNLDEAYNQNFQGDSRQGNKDLNTLINEYAPVFNAKINDMQK
jgi:ABC-type glycerol-3-phosphate transport system substrate-binding protein